MSKISTSDFQKGIFILFKNEPHQIVDFQFVNPGKGSAFVKTKLKSLNTGKVMEFTFKSGETVEEVAIITREMQYLYKTENDYHFMDPSNYEQITLDKAKLGDFKNFLKEGEKYQILINNNIGLGLRPPKKVRLEVTVAEEGARGNTVTGAKKTVLVETGLRVTVPLFIKKGDILAIDTESGQYLERVSQ